MTRMVAKIVVLLSLVLGSRPAAAAPIDDILSELDSFILAGDTAQQSMLESVAALIRVSPAEVYSTLLPRLSDTSLSERHKTMYVWAISLTRNREAVSAIIDLSRRDKSEMVRMGCRDALANLGGDQAGEYLITLYDSERDDDTKFSILNYLGQMQYEPALAKMEAVLKQDPKEYYWQPIFVFGKMGDKAVPFLLERIGHQDRRIRVNSINVLGGWLIPEAAAGPLKDRFWVEKDKELRAMILSALGGTMVGMEPMRVFFERVNAEEKDKDLTTFARETLSSLDSVKTVIQSYADSAKASPEAFLREYTKLFESAGHEGDYGILGASSTPEDEARLKALRERILQRDSDEAFYDFQKVNRIIVRNRWIKSLK